MISKINLKKIDKYWNSFYLKKNKDKNSTFAKFIKKRFLNKRRGRLIDLGCGDGRDTFYLSDINNETLGIDKSKIIIKKNNALVKINKNKKLYFKSKNVVSPSILTFGKFEYVYSRFFLHTINEKSQKKLFSNILTKITKKNSLCFFEFRTIKDQMYNLGLKQSKYERITDHYRRFIDVKKFVKLDYIYKNFEIIYLIERKNLSIHKKDNPVVCRIVLKKN